ncbi:repressor LexA [Candidatus Kaiserbacteria bacterium CG10_big_fil_rev_8_21_14_0_10_45_20]|uniref:Repressor LexA n=1 Tax=Candidatus Kaiserbacteria bacterium CG10_big_fil_rev_8_21_14_0_10_45_20 TaxID=1974607 RepID=A0A2H0UG19_9BACT|nr:MAG: repressor LexA [Candidatus Kaiserbacteria bacterium CG10_big_fil_rev_8_21_14_0_10_45_20]
MVTNNDIQYQRKITQFYRSHWRMPSYSEIMDITGLKSKDSVFKLTSRLTKLGVLSKDRRGRILPASVMTEVRVLGLVEAGIPATAEEEVLDTLSLDEYLVQDRDSSFLLRVKGDSMKDAGIIEGDMVLVEKTNNPKLGDIVVAEVDGGWTMKYYRKDKNGSVYLEPANDAYENIYPEGELNISAVVKGVIRKY